MENYPITAVIIARDEEDEIEGCLESVLKARPDEVIVVVDDRTNDSTFERARRYTPKVFEVKGYRSGLRNFGWKKARNDLICFIEADMRIPSDYFLPLITELNKDTDLASIGTRLLPLGDALCGKLEWILWDNAQIFGTAGAIYRKSALSCIDGFNENLESGEDSDLSHRIERAGWKRKFLRRPVAYHRFAQTWRVFFHKCRYGGRKYNPKAIVLFLASPIRAPLIAAKYRCWHVLWFYPLRWFYVAFFSGKKGYDPIR